MCVCECESVQRGGRREAGLTSPFSVVLCACLLSLFLFFPFSIMSHIDLWISAWAAGILGAMEC